MDELAAAADLDPLEFRLAHLDNPRLRAVLETAAQRFGWQEQIKKKKPNVGIGSPAAPRKALMWQHAQKLRLTLPRRRSRAARLPGVSIAAPS